MTKAALLIVALVLCLMPTSFATTPQAAPDLMGVQTVSLQQGVNGYNGNFSANLDAWNPAKTSSSALPLLSVRPGVVSGVSRFDLGSIPTNAYVTRAILTVFEASRTNSCPLTLYASRMLRSWAPREANWYQASANNDWEHPGAADPYVDHAMGVSAQANLSTENASYDLDVTGLVRDWAHNPSTNFGLALTGSAPCSVQYQVAAEGYSRADRRVKLTITYSVSAANDFSPTADFITPQHGNFVTGLTELSATASDDRGIVRVRYLLDSAVLGSSDVPPYRVTWDTSGASVGPHQLTVWAKDTSAQTTTKTIIVNVYRMDQGILTIGHISDVHVGTPWQGDPPNPALYAQRFQQALSELNSVIKPAVIINTGDSVNLADDYSCNLYASIAGTSVIAIKTIPGNHDLSDRNKYLAYIGPSKLWFDLGENRFIGFTTNELNAAWLRNLLASTDKSGIVFSHYLMRLPKGSTSSPWFFTLPATELAVLQNAMATYGAPAYLSGHYHSPFQLEDTVSHAVDIGAPSLGQKTAYDIVTSDNGVVSSNVHYLGDWPAVVVTSPQQYYADGGSKRLWGTVPVRVKVYGPAPITKVTWLVDGAKIGMMDAMGDNVWQAIWDTTSVTAGLHTLSARAIDSQGRSRQVDITVFAARPTASTPTPTPTRMPTATPTPTPATPHTAYSKRVNVGGPAYTDHAGRTWVADKPFVAGAWGYVGGLAHSTADSIAGTVDPGLFRTDRRWSYTAAPGYRFTVPNGSYTVSLKFAETSLSVSNQRRFDVVIEGTTVLSAFDILATAGGQDIAAPDQVFTVDVADGELTIDFVQIPGYSNPQVNAIEITSN